MKKSLIVSAVLLAMIAGPAFAADMPVKTPPPPPAPAVSWPNVYIGAQVGNEWSKDNWDPTCIDAGGAPLGTCGSALSLVVFPGAPDSAATFNMSGVRYGLYGGFTFPVYDRYLVGAEVDYAWHSRTGTVNGVLGCITAACSGGANGPGPFTGDSTSITNQNDYSLRFRAGYLVTPELQIYAAAGPAAQKVSATVVCGATGAVVCGFGTLVSTSSTTLFGYTVGGGIEWKVWNNVLLRGEYRYNDYGTWKQSAFVQSGIVEEFADVHVKSQMLTFGVAYLFTPGAQ